MSKEEIFTKITLPSGKSAIVYEGKGIHFFRALLNAKGDTSIVIKWLMIDLLEVDGSKLTEKTINEMPIRDISYASSVIGTMMSSDPVF